MVMDEIITHLEGGDRLWMCVIQKESMLTLHNYYKYSFYSFIFKSTFTFILFMSIHSWLYSIKVTFYVYLIAEHSLSSVFTLFASE